MDPFMPHRILWKIKFSTSIRTTKISEVVVGPCIYFISLWWGQEWEALEINILGTFNKNTRLICIYSSVKAIKIWTFICIAFILIVNISLGNKKINLLANLLTITMKRHTWSYTNMFLIVNVPWPFYIQLQRSREEGELSWKDGMESMDILS